MIRFPGCELAFDAYSLVHVWRHNLQSSGSKVNLRLRWGIWRGRVIEKWSDGIHLINEWGFFDETTERLDRIRWLRWMDSIFRTQRIYHFQLEKMNQ